MPRFQFVQHEPSAMKLGNGADIAFLLVVLSAYFSIFSSLEKISVIHLALIIILGVLYLMLGIYGYGILRRYQHFALDVTYFLIQIFIGSMILLLGVVEEKNLSLVALLYLPLVVQSVLILPQYWMLFVNVAILVAYTMVVLTKNTATTSTISFPLFFTAQIFIVFFTQMAVNEARSRGEVERLVTELADANEHLRNYALKVEELAVTQERNRLAREIHDGLGHYLTSIHIQLQAAEAVLRNQSDFQTALAGISKAQNLAKNALADVRQSVSTLRSPLIGLVPLSQMIRDHLNQTPTGSIEIDFDTIGEEIELPTNIGWTIFRTTQEAVNNAIKHAQCSKITVKLSYEKNQVNLLVEDNGVGSTDPSGGYGLLGLRERIHLLNGEFRITTAENQGFQVEIKVPIL